MYGQTEGPTDFIRRMQAMGCTPREDGESWDDYLRKVERTLKYLTTGEVAA